MLRGAQLGISSILFSRLLAFTLVYLDPYHGYVLLPSVPKAQLNEEEVIQFFPPALLSYDSHKLYIFKLYNVIFFKKWKWHNVTECLGPIEFNKKTKLGLACFCWAFMTLQDPKVQN